MTDTKHTLFSKADGESFWFTVLDLFATRRGRTYMSNSVSIRKSSMKMTLSMGAALLQQKAKLLFQNSENILNLRAVETTRGFVEFTAVFSSYTQSQD